MDIFCDGSGWLGNWMVGPLDVDGADLTPLPKVRSQQKNSRPTSPSRTDRSGEGPSRRRPRGKSLPEISVSSRASCLSAAGTSGIGRWTYAGEPDPRIRLSVRIGSRCAGHHKKALRCPVSKLRTAMPCIGMHPSDEELSGDVPRCLCGGCCVV